MNALIPRFLKLAYRKEPISGFILIFGVVDALIGGFDSRWTLLSFGVMMALLALILRWWKVQKAEAISIKDTPRYFLPPSSSQIPVPMLTSEKKHR
jgi:hypothetical protein